MERGPLKREPRVIFHSATGGTGLLNERGEKDSIMVRVCDLHLDDVLKCWASQLVSQGIVFL